MQKTNIPLEETIDQKRRIIADKTLLDELKHAARAYRGTIIASSLAVAAATVGTYFWNQYQQERREKIVPIQIWKQQDAICMTAGGEPYLVGVANPTSQDGRNSLYQKMNRKNIDAGLLSKENTSSHDTLKNLNVAFNIANEGATSKIINSIRQGMSPYDQKRPYTIVPGVERAIFGKTYVHEGKNTVNAIGYGGSFCQLK